MRRIDRAIVALGLGAALLAGCATSGGEASPAAAAAAPARSGIAAEEAVTVSATVESIDHATRMVTLRGPEGKTINFRAGPEVRNLAQVQQGDVVQVAYYESLAWHVRKPGEATPGVAAAAAVGRAEPGEKPGAAGIEAITVTTTIEAIDRAARTVTLKGADGKLATIPVKNPANLEGVAVGDLVEITYTEALAISVETPAKK